MLPLVQADRPKRRALAMLLRSAPERSFLARAWLLAPAVELSLKVRGVAGTLAWLERIPRARKAGELAATGTREALAASERAHRLVALAFRAQPFLRGACLERSLVQFGLHRRDGVPARLVIGVRRPGETEARRPNAVPLDAHAWVEGPSAEPQHRSYLPILVREAG